MSEDIEKIAKKYFHPDDLENLFDFAGFANEVEQRTKEACLYAAWSFFKQPNEAIIFNPINYRKLDAALQEAIDSVGKT